MRIALDIRYKTYSGGATYALEIARNLLEADLDNSYVIVKHPAQALPTERTPDAIIEVPYWANILDILWTVLILPFRLRRLKVDVYHPLKTFSPYWNFAATVSTMHAPYGKYKGEYPLSPIVKAYWLLYGKPQMKMNTAVIAVSKFLADYCIEVVKVPKERVHVIYNGSNEAFRPMEPAEFMPVLQRLGLSPGYVLCVGNVTVVKNHITAIRALADLVDRVDAKLVIAGATVHRHSCYHELLAEIQRLRLGDRVRFLGLVDRDDVAALLNGARVMAFPSLQEGCPVAMIECFKCGTPLIGSVVPPVAELGRGVAPLLDDPCDHRQLAAYLLEVLTSDQRHAELRRLALEAGSRYSWRQSALAHLEVYRECHRIRQLGQAVPESPGAGSRTESRQTMARPDP
jgi:glycosyltransferase involved in cell wall biosynthesis